MMPFYSNFYGHDMGDIGLFGWLTGVLFDIILILVIIWLWQQIQKKK